MWLFSTMKRPSGYSASSTAEEVTQGVDGTGLTAIVTGASSGIGAETARVLAMRGVHVVMAVRSLEAAEKVKETIFQQVCDAKVDAMELDLSSMESVRQFAKEFNSSNRPLNILINNAGVMATPFTLSKDGIELQFATNHIGHFLLTNLLLDTMKRTASKSQTEGRTASKSQTEGRIINVSSRRHQFSYPEGIRFNHINDKSRYSMLSAYGQSKLANVLHTNELARRLKKDGAAVTANSLHPGAIATNLFRHHTIFSSLIDYFGKYFIKNVEQGAATTCYVALHPGVKEISGKYFADSNVAEVSAIANDAELAKKLWDFSLNLTN